MKKILLIFGTRPECIKMAPLYHALKEEKNVFDPVLCVTGQHRSLLDQSMSVFGMTADFDLNLMSPNQNLFKLTSEILLGLKKIIEKENPEIVLVHGDTTSTFAGALAAFYREVKVGHVEAGMRSHDIQNPFPEEFNRKAVANISDLHFAPTQVCKNNLLQENIPEERIVVTGNTVVDALFWMINKLDGNPDLKNNITQNLRDLLEFDFINERFILITGHRRESFGSGLKQICLAIREIALNHPRIYFVYPAHLNPQVQKAVHEILGDVKNIRVCEPVGYEAFVILMRESYFLITDSGGIQEEAPSLGKPVLVTRTVTERPEAVDVGTVKLVGMNKATIEREVALLLGKSSLYSKMAHAHNPYGDGRACCRIIEKLREL